MGCGPSFRSGLARAPRRYHEAMYSLRELGYDPEAMRAVAAVYRRERHAA